jgi:tripartite-type tricarboxylate transporter receptor subunit TctC
LLHIPYKGNPPAITDLLAGQTALLCALCSRRTCRAGWRARGARFVPATPQQFGAYVTAQIAKWAPVVKASGARAD